jgi:hypothetical protein
MFSELELAGSYSECCPAVGLGVSSTKIAGTTKKLYIYLFAYIYL